MSGFLKKILVYVLLITPLLSGCSNLFEHKESKWKHISSSSGENTQVFYLDENRTECESFVCKAWTKLVFSVESPITFSGSTPATTMVKRIDSLVEYHCSQKTSSVLSYQLYNKEDELIYSNWPNKPLKQLIRANSIDQKFYDYLCKKR